MKLRRCIGLLVIAGLLGCDELPPPLPDPGPDAGPDRSIVLDSATDDQLAMLCDWVAGRVGGYGRQKTCASSRIMSQDSQEICVSKLQDVVCASPVTFAELEDCTNGVLGMCEDRFPPSACFALSSCVSPP